MAPNRSKRPRLVTLKSPIATLPSKLQTISGVPKPNSWRGGKGKTAERGYGGKWQRARATFLARPENALCRICQIEGRITAATVVDHITPHRGDQVLFWDRSNWQPLCTPCHDEKTRQGL